MKVIGTVLKIEVDITPMLIDGSKLKHDEDNGYLRKKYPTKSILDPDFKYVPSHSTDLKETFRRARERMNLI
jgi:hypothetical protein